MQLFRNDHKLTSSWDLVPISLNLIKTNFWPLFYLTFLPQLLIGMGFAIASKYAQITPLVLNTELSAGIILIFIGAVWSLLSYPGLIRMTLEAVAGKQPDAWDCFKKGFPRIISFVIMASLAGIAIFFGLLLLIIPGLILIRSFVLAQYYLIDKNLSPTDALKQSFAESKHHAGYIWGTLGVGIVFSMMSSSIGRIPVAGYILALLVSLLFVFGPALRYKEIQAAEMSKLQPVQK